MGGCKKPFYNNKMLRPITHFLFGFSQFGILFIAYLVCKMMLKRQNLNTHFFATKVSNEKMMQKQETSVVCNGHTTLLLHKKC